MTHSRLTPVLVVSPTLTSLLPGYLPVLLVFVFGQRLKQITWGKNTLGYDRYTALVPRHERRRDDATTPVTPDHTRVLAKRRWDGLVSAWRRALHAYDPPVAAAAAVQPLAAQHAAVAEAEAALAALRRRVSAARAAEEAAEEAAARVAVAGGFDVLGYEPSDAVRAAASEAAAAVEAAGGSSLLRCGRGAGGAGGAGSEEDEDLDFENDDLL